MKYLSLFIICLTVLAASSLASAQSPDPAIQGYRLSFMLGQEYQKVTNEGGSADAYNALVEQWNAFVRATYGNDTNMEFKSMGEENVNLQKPIAIGKNVTGNGIVHSVDGSGKYAPSYTTNDMNQLPDPGNMSQIKREGGDYLGGI